MTASEPTPTEHVSAQAPEGSLARASQAPVTIYVECTHTCHSDINTGIQRVVRNVIRNAPDVVARFGMRIVPVIVEESVFRVVDSERVLNSRQPVALTNASMDTAESTAAIWKHNTINYLRDVLKRGTRYIRSVIVAVLPFQPITQALLAPPSERGLHRLLRSTINRIRRRGKAQPPGPRLGYEEGATTANRSRAGKPQELDHTGNILLLLDSSWTAPLWDATRAFKQQGGTVIGVIYDLIPVSHPHACVPQLTAAFTEWLREYCTTADATIAISRSVMRQYEMYVQLCFAGKPSVLRAPVSYFHLGSDLDLTGDIKNPSQRMLAIFERKVPTFLMVGSIEPRKNHAFVLDAFDKLWAKGHDARLILVGGQAWRTEDLLKRIERHPRFRKGLFLFRDASDAELEQCYLGSDALIIASEIEGFGLPIVEASRRNLPVICSDIPVFREIGGDAVKYFDLDDPASLAVAIANFGQTAGERTQENPAWLTWRQSTEALFQSISEINAMLRVSPRKIELAKVEPQGANAVPSASIGSGKVA